MDPIRTDGRQNPLILHDQMTEIISRLEQLKAESVEYLDLDGPNGEIEVILKSANQTHKSFKVESPRSAVKREDQESNDLGVAHLPTGEVIYVTR